jgi:hypothetical protein
MLLVYLGLTILLELPFFLLFWHKEGWWQAVVFCILLNGFTNPLINLAISELGWNVYLLEVAVLLTEALAAMIVFKARFTKALLFSFCANAFSYGTGVILFAVGFLG